MNWGLLRGKAYKQRDAFVRAMARSKHATPPKDWDRRADGELLVFSWRVHPDGSREATLTA